jgi:hypothetical protein
MTGWPAGSDRDEPQAVPDQRFNPKLVAFVAMSAT